LGVAGYPESVLVTVLVIGLLLAVFRPYMALLLSVFLLTAGNIGDLNQTRTSLLGPYLNLGDACLLIAVVALFIENMRSKMPLLLPQVVLLLLLVLTIGLYQSLWKLGLTYETMRAYRWGLELPLSLFLGANFVTSAARAKKLVGALFCGAALTALQHILFVWTAWRQLDVQAYSAIRTIGFWGGCMASAFLVTAVIWKPPANMWKKIVLVVAGVLFLATLLMNQTRSLWFATAGAIPLLVLLFKRTNRLASLMRYTVITVVVILGTALVVRQVLPGLSFFDLTTSRFEMLMDDNTRKMQTSTRERSFYIEMNNWMDGTLVFGRGLYFFQTFRNPKEDWREYAAFGHLGYVTYLSQLGLIGFLVYGLYLPLSIIRDGRWLWYHSDDPAIRYTALLGTASMICLSIMFIISSQFLSSGYAAPGVLYGAIWALARQPKPIEESVCPDIVHGIS
jgi:hypothetical protein